MPATLHVDLAAITANAAKVKSIAEQAGWRLHGVIKQGYAHKPIVRAFLDGGVDHLAFSTLREAARLGSLHLRRDQRSMIALPLPTDAQGVMEVFATSVHSSTASLERFAEHGRKGGEAHGVLIAIRTLEDREGIPAAACDRLLDLVASSQPLCVVGVLANFGCRVERPPSPEDLAPIWDVARRLAVMTGRPQIVSLGGSVLLPALPSAPVGQVVVLRVGEAIFAGSVPGAPADRTFVRPFRLEARVLEVSSGHAAERVQRILVDCGGTMLDPSDVTVDAAPARVAHLSGECACLDVSAAAGPFRVGDPVSLGLGYKSAIKALLHPAAEVRWA